MTESFKPFQNDAQVLSLGNLTIENGTDKISIIGDLDIQADPSGLARLKELADVVSRAIDFLENHPNINTTEQDTAILENKKNPFL